MLDPGTPAPDLELQLTDGRLVRLSDLRGENVLLYFMRTATCAKCNAHVSDLAARRDELEAQGVRVLVALPEDLATATSWKAKREVPFEVAVGQSGTPHEAFGLNTKMFGMMQQSGTVLVDRAGVVRHVHAATVPSYDREGILKAIRDLRPVAA